jgi:hypothetical protein
MSNQAINDYLTKQLFIERNVVSSSRKLSWSSQLFDLLLPDRVDHKVTYRSLSRELAIHVNAAKKWV